MEKVNTRAKFNLFSEYWSPKIVGEVNESAIKLVKFKGEFLWHAHETEDEIFYVLKGKLVILFRDKEITLDEGEFLIIPHGVEHMPVAEEEVHVMLIEPKTTLNTGNVESARTLRNLDRI